MLRFSYVYPDYWLMARKISGFLIYGAEKAWRALTLTPRFALKSALGDSAARGRGARAARALSHERVESGRCPLYHIHTKSIGAFWHSGASIRDKKNKQTMAPRDKHWRAALNLQGIYMNVSHNCFFILFYVLQFSNPRCGHSLSPALARGLMGAGHEMSPDSQNKVLVESCKSERL
jgi:hypothetical protein